MSKERKTLNSLFLLISFSLLLIVSRPFVPQAFSAQENPCVACHADFNKPAKSVHAALGMGCASCHKAVEGKNHPDQKGSIVLTQNMPGLCYNCHDESKFKGKAVHQPIAGGMCTGCHNPHQSNFAKLLVKDVPGLCYNCHNESKFKGKSGHTNLGMCTGCHNPHSSNSNKILRADQPELCYTCHEKAKFTKKYIHAIIPAGGCTPCHTPHASDNPSLLLYKDINELCVTCHVPQSKGQHVTSAVMGGSKRKYHPIRGAIDPRFPGKTKKIPDPKNPGKEIEVPDPDHPGKEINCASCHNPHSSDFRRLFPAASVCGLCHEYY